MSNDLVLRQAGALSKTLGIDSANPGELVEVLKNTVFRTKPGEAPVTDAQMTALLIVSNQYGLNPWTKEIYAYPDKNNGIVPVVGVDGWSRITNDHPMFDGIEFEYGPKLEGGKRHEWIEAIITRKDRSKPIRVREFWSEVNRDTTAWKSHPNRMHRHKSMIQCSRIAFGFGGIYDADEAEAIIGVVETSAGPADFLPKAAGSPKAAGGDIIDAEFSLTPKATAGATTPPVADPSPAAPAAGSGQAPAAADGGAGAGKAAAVTTQQKPTQDSTDTAIATPGWHKRLRAIAATKNIPEPDFLMHFELQALEGITQGKAKEVANWLTAQAVRQPANGSQKAA